MPNGRAKALGRSAGLRQQAGQPRQAGMAHKASRHHPIQMGCDTGCTECGPAQAPRGQKTALHGQNQRNDPSHQPERPGWLQQGRPAHCHRSAADLPPQRAWPQHRGRPTIFSTSGFFFCPFRAGYSTNPRKPACTPPHSSHTHVVLNPGSIASTKVFSCGIVRCRTAGIPNGICCCFRNS